MRAYLETRRENLRRVDLDVASFMIVTAAEAIIHEACRTHPEYLEDDRLVDELANMFLRYVRKDE